MDAVIFDMDGLLMDSEPLWKQAAVEGFASVGFVFGEADFREAQGMRIDLIVDYWYEKRPWRGIPPAELADLITDIAIGKINAIGTPKPGARAIVKFFKEIGLPVAVASSSPCRVIMANIAALDMADHFDTISSAEGELHSKPHPAVYLKAAEKLNVHPRRCLVFEDSVIGVLSAKAAEMTCICVPDQEVADDKRLGIADYVLPSLEHFDLELWNQICLG